MDALWILLAEVIGVGLRGEALQGVHRPNWGSYRVPATTTDQSDRAGHLVSTLARQIGCPVVHEPTPALEQVHIHDRRHSYSAHAVMSGLDLYTLGRLLAHADTGSTERYAHLADDHVRAAAADSVRPVSQGDWITSDPAPPPDRPGRPRTL